MMPTVASAVTNGDRPPTVGGSDGISPLMISPDEIAQAGSHCSITSDSSVTSVNVPTSRIDTRSMRR